MNEKDVKLCYDFFDDMKEIELRVFNEKYGESIFINSKEKWFDFVKKYQDKNRDVYFGRNERKSKSKGNVNVISMKTILVDLDLHEDFSMNELNKRAEEFEKHTQEYGLNYSVKIFTGGGFQYYYEIPKIKDNEKIKELLDKSKYLFTEKLKLNVDKSVFNSERVSRVWGTYNNKRKTQGYVVEIKKDVDVEKNYNLFNNVIIEEHKKEFIKEDVPKYCKFLEEVACKKELPSNKLTRHNYLDGNAYQYFKDKPDKFNDYKNTQSRTDTAFNNCDNWEWSCKTIQKYAKENNVNEIENCCNDCPYNSSKSLEKKCFFKINDFEIKIVIYFDICEVFINYELKSSRDFKKIDDLLIGKIAKILELNGVCNNKEDALIELNKVNLLTKLINLKKEFDLKKPEKTEPVIDETQIDKRFYDVNLINHIYDELDKDHKCDKKEKIGAFIVALSSELRNSSDHCSVAFKGGSSSGKDNIIKTIFKHLPKEDSFFLTRATSSALEDEAINCKRIAFSEINKHRENGANSDIVETFKQFAEGGVSVIKKDASKGFSETKRIEVEQKTLLYGTTETETDDELETRYITIPIRTSKFKNQIIVNSELVKASNFNVCINESESWISKSIRNLENDFDIIIPYAEIFTKPFFDKQKNDYIVLFDMKKDRIKRDVKRLLSLTRTITYLYQKQRNVIEKDERKYLISEISDFLIAFEIFTDFFNLTYTGLDHRHQNCLDKIKELEGKHKNEITSYNFSVDFSNWVVRHLLAEELDVSLPTVKKYVKFLQENLFVETHWDKHNPKGYLVRAYKEHISSIQKAITFHPVIPYLYAFYSPENLDKWYKNKKIEEIKLLFINKPQKIKKNVVKDKQICMQKICMQKTREDILKKLKRNEEYKIVDLIKNYDISDKNIKQLINEGFIFEVKSGVIKLL